MIKCHNIENFSFFFLLRQKYCSWSIDFSFEQSEYTNFIRLLGRNLNRIDMMINITKQKQKINVIENEIKN